MAIALTAEQQEYLDLLQDPYQEFRAAFTHVVKQDNDPAHVTLVEQPPLQLELREARDRMLKALDRFERVFPDGSSLQTPRLPSTRGGIVVGIPTP